MRGVNNLIHLTLSWEVSPQNLSRSHRTSRYRHRRILGCCRRRRETAVDCCRSPVDGSESFSPSLSVQISARKYTFAKSATTDRSGMSMNRNPCSLSDDPPRSPSHPIPSPATLSLSLDEGRSRLSNTRCAVRTVESLFA